MTDDMGLADRSVWALGFSYVAACAMAGWLWAGPFNDLDAFFLPAARIALGGHPLLVYAVRFQEILANDNGPLGLVPLTAVVALASWLGWLNDVHLLRGLIVGAFSIFSLLMAREAVGAIDRLRGARLEGRWRLLAYGAFAAAPPLWVSVLGYGHVEQPLTLWLVLLGVRHFAGGRSRVAGVSVGLAMLTRTVATLQLIPLAVVLLLRGRRGRAAWLVGTAALTTALGVVPFLLGDPGDTVYALLTHRGQRPPGGGSFWQLLVGTPYQWIPQRADVFFVLGAAVLVSVIVIRARRELEPSSRDIYGLLALTALALLLLAKSVWPYYFLDAYVFGSVWWLAQAAPLAWGRGLLGATFPVVATIGTVLTDYQVESTDGRIRLPEGVGMGLLLAAVATVLLSQLCRPGSVGDAGLD